MKTNYVSGKTQFTVTDENVDGVYHPYYINIISKSGYGSFITVVVTPYPTGNCQLWSLSYMNAILDNIDDDSEVEKLISYITFSIVMKRALVIDVAWYYVDRLRKIFGSYIAHEMRYDSPNGSDMCIMLLNFKSY